MSITVTTDVFCDQCPTWVHGVTGSIARTRDARAEAKRQGWVYVNTARPGSGLVRMSDLCPDCAREADQ